MPCRQDYPSDLLEIIIVNDNSTDRTPIVVSEFIAKNKLQSSIVMKLIYNPFSGKKRAIRHGVEKASGELILTTDADCTVGPGWVSAHAAAYACRGENANAGANDFRNEEASTGLYAFRDEGANPGANASAEEEAHAGDGRGGALT